MFSVSSLSLKGHGGCSSTKLPMSARKFGSCSSRVIPFPIGLTTRHVVEIFHAAIGRDNVGARRDEIAIRREFVGYMLLGMV